MEFFALSFDRENNPWMRREPQVHQVLIKRFVPTTQPLVKRMPGMIRDGGQRFRLAMLRQVLMESQQNLG